MIIPTLRNHTRRTGQLLRQMATGMIAICLLVAGGRTAEAEDIKLAVAANFLKPIRVIAKKFEKETGNRVKISAGSTGKLYAQIKKGAPFDAFLAANSREPKRLETEGDIVPASLFVYAVGQLVLWTHQKGVDPKKMLLDAHYEHIALANPKLAPYGKAAVETMEKLGVMSAAAPKLIKCETVSQAHQFAVIGNVELSFFAYSQIAMADEADKGSSWVVPADQHSKIEQAAVLLKTGEANKAASDFLAFLKTDPVRKLIVEYGYMVE